MVTSPGFNVNIRPYLAAEVHPPLAARDAENLMDPGVIVHVVVDAAAPCAALSVRFQQVLDQGRRVVTVIEIDEAPIEDERPP